MSQMHSIKESNGGHQLNVFQYLSISRHNHTYVLFQLNYKGKERDGIIPNKQENHKPNTKAARNDGTPAPPAPTPSDPMPSDSYQPASFGDNIQ